MVDTADYQVDLDNDMLKGALEDGEQAVTDLEQVYSGMINQSDAFYQQQINASKEWADKQSQLQQDRTDFTIQQIEQQKDQEKKDYTKEQSGAYVDWQKQSNAYGANAEALASQGMAGSGYSESSQVSMYNTYQNRVTAARDSYNRAVLNYNNAIKDARLANNSALAEIAYNALQKQLELSLQGFQYKNQLVSDLADKKLQTQTYWRQVYNDILAQLNTEADRAFKVDSHNETQALNEAQLQLQRDQFAWQKEQAAKSASITKTSSGSSSSGGSKGSGSSSGGKASSSTISGKSSNGAASFATYDSAVAYLNKNGISGDGGLLIRSEWEGRKNSGSKRAPAAYDTYEDYLYHFVQHKLKNPD